MQKLLDTNLYVGNINDLAMLNENECAIVHATQTIHYKYFGWNRTTNKPDKNHKNYIYYENGNHLSLNWVDGPAHLYNWSGTKIFTNVLDFIEKWIQTRKVFVHCDQGISRSPSLCLLYLSKRANKLDNSSYEKEKGNFIDIFPNYNPGGIGDFIKEHWNSIK